MAFGPIGGGVGSSTATSGMPNTSAGMRNVLTDETGTGAAVFGTSPTIAAPTITGAETHTGTINGAVILAALNILNQTNFGGL